MSPVPVPPARRDLLRAVALLPATGAAVVAGAAAGSHPWRREPALRCEGVVIEADGAVCALSPGTAAVYGPGTRVRASARGSEAASRQRRRRSGARLPESRWAGLADDALADLLALTGPILATQGQPPTVFPTGAVVAGPVGGWRYTWPRDASFAAAAFSAVGLRDEALAVLAHLAEVQRPDGGFEARYTASGGVPDSRPAQGEGAGWMLWAAGRVMADGAGIDELGTVCGAGLVRAVGNLMALTDTPSHLPPASPDYWEVPERVLTLGTAAPVLLGLEAAAALEGAGLGVGAFAGLSAQRAQTVRAAMERAFSPDWGRHAGDDDVDAAIALVGPPFTRAPAGATAARRSAAERMRRASGGVAPGRSWRDDGVSWTPETTLLAWSAAALGLTREAAGLLDWVDHHRTAVGALPEKVRADGTPAGPAPLAWTCALVLLAARLTV